MMLRCFGITFAEVNLNGGPKKRKLKGGDMTVKKKILIVAMVASLGLAGLQQVSARGWNDGDCDCYNNNARYQTLDESTKTKIEAFQASSLQLRKQMAMKRAEKTALLEAQTPNPQAVSKVAGEIFDLRQAIKEKANEAGLTRVPRGMGMQPRIAHKGMGGGCKGKGRGWN